MAEICCDVVSGSETSVTTCEPTSRAVRKRRVETRRFRFVAAGVAAPAVDSGRKRPRIDCSSPAAVPVAVTAMSPPDLEFPVVENGLDGVGASAVRLDPKSNSDPSVAPSSDPSLSTAFDHCPRYGVTSVCGRRRDMEDAVSVRPAFVRRGRHAAVGFHFFGIYDGHGCSHVAESCKDRMHEAVKDELEGHGGSSNLHLAETEWKAVMQRSFARVDTQVVGWSNGEPRNANCRCEMQTPKCDHVGSTAVVAVVTPDHVVVANCGDSRAILCRKGVPIPLSSDHKPDRPDELHRIQAAGGRVIYWDGARVLGVLAMSRAIGDNYLKPYVISEPEVTVTERTDDDECLILASDGLWDVVTNETACKVVRMCLRAPSGSPTSPPPEPETREGRCAGGSDRACSDAALLLMKLALARQSSDNVSVVVVDLRRSRS